MKKWKVAIVGAGYMAQEHAKALRSLNSVELVGVCGRSGSRAEALGKVFAIPTYNSVVEMYAATRADAVVVAVNELSMADVCSAIFKFPWICLLEKPVGVSLQVANRILDESQRNGARAFVALNRRSYSATRQALEELSKDDSPRLISVLDQEDQQAARASGQPEEVVRHWMFANSIHLVDYFSFMARGDVLAVQHAAPWMPQSSSFVAATIRFSSGDVGIYQAVWNGPGPWAVTVTNQLVRLELRPLEKLAVQRRGERRMVEIAPEAVDADYKPGLRYQAEQMVSVLEGQASSLATLEQATRSMTLCAKIYGFI